MKKLKLCFLVLFVVIFPLTVAAQDVPLMDKDVLKSEMDSSIIVDVRSGSDWRASEFKIVGAVRPKGSIAEFAASQGWDKDAKIVLYCA